MKTPHRILLLLSSLAAMPSALADDRPWSSDPNQRLHDSIMRDIEQARDSANSSGRSSGGNPQVLVPTFEFLQRKGTEETAAERQLRLEKEERARKEAEERARIDAMYAEYERSREKMRPMLEQAYREGREEPMLTSREAEEIVEGRLNSKYAGPYDCLRRYEYRMSIRSSPNGSYTPYMGRDGSTADWFIDPLEECVIESEQRNPASDAYTPQAAFYLAEMYRNGLVRTDYGKERRIKPNAKKALEYYRLAAGFATLPRNAYGRLVARDGKGRENVVTREAEAYALLASYALVDLYAKGEGVPKDEAAARKLARDTVEAFGKAHLHDLAQLNPAVVSHRYRGDIRHYAHYDAVKAIVEPEISRFVGENFRAD